MGIKKTRIIREENDPFDQSAIYERRKLMILQEATRCFNELGYSATSLRYLAKRLNLTDAALYYYVKNKEQLVFMCYERAFDVGEEGLRRAVEETETSHDALRLFIELGVEAMLGDAGTLAVVSEISALGPEYRDKLLGRSVRITRRVAEIIDRGVAEGSISPCNSRLVGDVILGTLNWIPKWYKPDKFKDITEIKRAFTFTLMSGLTPR